jgi:hypothetical protein
MTDLGQRLTQRKLVQWAAAHLAVGFAMLGKPAFIWSAP